MARSRSKKPPQTAPRSAQPAQSAGLRRPDVTGALVLASMLTAAVPAFWQGLTDASRIVGVLVVAAGWALAWALGAVRFERRQLWWLAGLGAITASLVVTSLLANQPLAELLGGLGTRMGAVYWFAIIVSAAGASAAKYDSRLRLWIAGIYLWALPAALFGIAQALLRQPVTAGLLNDNLFALAMLLLTPPAIGLALTTRKPAERTVWLAVAGVLAVAIVLSGARAAAVALLAEAGLALALLAPTAASQRARLLRGAGFAVVGLAMAAIVAVVGLGFAGSPSVSALAERAMGWTFSARSFIWSGAMQTFSHSPIVGYGPDGYQFASQRFVQPGLMALERGNAIVNNTPADPHSLPLRLLVGMGLLGVAAVGLSVWGWFVAIGRADPPSAGAGALRTSFAIAAGGFALGALFAPWPVTIGLLPAAAIGLAAAGFGRDRRLAEPPAPVRWVLGAAIGGLFLALAVSVFGQSATFSLAVDAGSAAQRQTALERSLGWAPYSFETRFQVLWSAGDSVSLGVGDVRAFQKAVDADTMVSGYAPALAEFVRQSLLEAERSKRTDLSWERTTTESASKLAPGIPDVIAERLHLALVSGDKVAIAKALADTKGLAAQSPLFASYVSTAEAVLSAK